MHAISFHVNIEIDTPHAALQMLRNFQSSEFPRRCNGVLLTMRSYNDDADDYAPAISDFMDVNNELGYICIICDIPLNQVSGLIKQHNV